jgi:DNA-binding YbaB/EbfC family protein
MKNLGQMMQKVQEMQSRMGEMQSRLAEMELSGQSGGGMITATMNGKGELRRMKIDPSLVTPGDVAILEDLIVAAVNDAKGKVETAAQSEMGKITGGLPLPPGFKLPF